MPDYFNSCPNCGHYPQKGLLTGGMMDVYSCDKCNQRYCYKCPGTYQGRECPKCGSGEHTSIGKVAAR